MIYLDNAATSWPKPPGVIEAVQHYFDRVGASPGRSGHRPSLAAGRIVENTRLGLGELLGVTDPSRIAFTHNATDSLNMAIHGLIHAGDHVISSVMEHNSVLRPLTRMAREERISLTLVKAREDGKVLPEFISRAITPETSTVVLTHASNVTGTLNPLEEIGSMLSACGIRFVVDAAQTAGLVPMDLEDLPIDVLAVSGHKGLLGPQGTGAIYVRPGIDLGYWREGGTGNQSHITIHPEAMPERLEAGTPNTPGLAGLGAGIEYLLEVGVGEVRRRECALVDLLIDGLSPLPGLRVLGPSSSEERSGVVSITVAGRDPADMAYALDSGFDIMVRPGIHCAPEAHRSLGTYPEGALRLSPGLFTTEEEVLITCRAVKSLIG